MGDVRSFAGGVKAGQAGQEKQEADKAQGKPTVATIQALMSELKVRIRLNLITGLVEVDGMPSRYSATNAPETIRPFLQDEARQRGIKASKQLVEDALSMTADNNRYNPVADMLTAGEWDGVKRFPELCRAMRLPPDSLDVVLLQKWMHQCVSMALNDELSPYGADGVLTLQGQQGIGKTRLFALLSCRPAWFAEGVSIDTNQKDTVIQSTGVWIAELGELDSTLRREQAALKAFLTASTDTYRVPYGRAWVKRPRRTSFCATVNPDGFLNDPTGSRRFWTIHLDGIDLDYLNQHGVEWYEQLWREIYTLHYLSDKQGFRLTANERAELLKRNEEFEKPLAFEIDIREALDWSMTVDRWKWWTVTSIKNELMLYSADSGRVGRALRKISDSCKDSQVKNIHNIKRYYLPPKRSLVS